MYIGGNFDYEYRWGNNPVRARLKGKRCRVLARGTMRSVLLEFEDGYKTVSSERSIKKATDGR